VRKFLLLTLAIAACAGAAHVGTAQAIAACGTITSSTTLAADCSAPLIVGASGIVVDLGGHSVVCNSSQAVGLSVPNGTSAVTVRNGKVRANNATCLEGVNVEGDFNQVTSVTESGGSDGFVVGGDSNTLLLATAASNFSDGVAVFGDNNTVRQATLMENLNGADFILGHRNTITRSRIFLNETGISVDGDAMDIDQNHVFRNNTGIYFSGGSQRSVVFLNQAYLNEVGIRIDDLSSGSNSVFVNGSYANFTWDMEDDNANCDSNLWFNNVFGTANQNCIH
jgi:copper-binding protein NosD